MTIKQQILTKIEQLEEMDYPVDTYEQSVGFYNALDRIKAFLDALPDEPVTTCDQLGPVTDCHELEEEAVSYCFDNGLNLSPRVATDFARHFAEWQKRKMMKDAKDGYVSAIIIHNDGDEEHYAVTYPNGERPHSITDKVKIIIL